MEPEQRIQLGVEHPQSAKCAAKGMELEKCPVAQRDDDLTIKTGRV